MNANKLLGIYVLIFSTLMSCNSDSSSIQDNNADLIITGAKIFTSNPQQPWAEALAIKEGKFIYVGDSAESSKYISQNTRSIHLNGELIIPGMVDAHAHPGYVDVEHYGDIDEDNKEDMLDAIKEYSDEHPDDEWLRICCWPSRWYINGNKGPTKEELDAIVPDRPIWFGSGSWHDCWLNSKALEAIGVDKSTPDPRVGLATYVRDENGEPTGWVKEGAGWQHFIEEFGFAEGAHKKSHEKNIVIALQTLSRAGVTTVYDAGNFGFDDQVYSFIAKLEKEGKLPVRYEGTYQIFTPERTELAISEMKRFREEYGGKLLQFNTVKIFMDGINENHSGGVLRPYMDDPSYVANTMLSVEELKDFLLELSKEKMDVHIHTIGDLAVRNVLDAVEAAQKIDKQFYPRVTIAHLELIDPSDAPRIKELGVICNFTPWWIGVEHNDIVKVALGEDRYANTYKAKTLFDAGVIVNFSSDTWWSHERDVTYLNPYLGMQVGHTRQYPKDWWETEDDGIRAPSDERLSIEQLITGYTINGAYQVRMENLIGSIENGKLADFLVLDKNLFDVDQYEIQNVKPSAVVMEGNIIQGSLTE